MLILGPTTFGVDDASMLLHGWIELRLIPFSMKTNGSCLMGYCDMHSVNLQRHLIIMDPSFEGAHDSIFSTGQSLALMW